MNISLLAYQAAAVARPEPGSVLVAGMGQGGEYIRIDTLSLERFTSISLAERLKGEDIFLPLLTAHPDLVGICAVVATAAQERVFIAAMIGAKTAFGLGGMWLADPILTTPTFDSYRTISLDEGSMP